MKNKLRGELRLQSFMDMGIMWTALGVIVMLLLLGPRDIENGIYYSNYILLFMFFPCIPIFDCTFLFPLRYSAHSQYSSSRKLFYNAHLIAAFVKSIFISIVLIIYMAAEKLFYSCRGIKYGLDIFGEKNINISAVNFGEIFMVFLMIVIFSYSIGTLLAATEKLQVISFIFQAAVINVINVFIIGESVVNFNNCYAAILIFLVISVINFALAWQIIKRKSSLGDSLFARVVLRKHN